MKSTTVAILAKRTNRSVHEVERSWRRSKQFVRDAGDKANYLRAFKVLCEMLKIKNADKLPSVAGEKIILDGVEGKIETSIPGFVIMRQGEQCVLFPLVALIDFV